MRRELNSWRYDLLVSGDSIRMDPYYTDDDLQVITVTELRDRVSMIHNSRAQQVAHELWRRMDVVFTTSEPWPRKFLLPQRTLYELSGPLGRGPLLEMARRLRAVNFNRQLNSLTEPGQGGKLSLGLNPVRNRSKQHINIEAAAWLHTQLESVMSGRQRLPFHLRRNVLCTLILACTALALTLQHEWIWQRFLHEFWQLPSLLLAILLVYGIWYRMTFWVEDKMRILALYLAFTDEFVGVDPLL